MPVHCVRLSATSKWFTYDTIITNTLAGLETDQCLSYRVDWWQPRSRHSDNRGANGDVMLCFNRHANCHSTLPKSLREAAAVWPIILQFVHSHACATVLHSHLCPILVGKCGAQTHAIILKANTALPWIDIDVCEARKRMHSKKETFWCPYIFMTASSLFFVVALML